MAPEASPAPAQERLELGEGDYAVEPPDFGRYDLDEGGR